MWGIFVALIEVVTTIGEAVIFGIPALMGWIAYHVTGGKTGGDGYNKVNKFFSSFSKMFHVVDMWNQVKLEADLMEGSFSECKKAFHYTSKVFQTITNIVLIFLAGIGIVKGGIKLVKNASKLGKLATLQKFVKGTKTSLAKGGKAVASLITKPRVVLRYSKARINKIMFAALDEGYYLNLRKQSMKNSVKERIYWKKHKGKWKKTATKKEKTANEIEKNYNAIENQKDPTKAEKLAKETIEKTEQLNKETFNELDDIKKGKSSKFEEGSSLNNINESGRNYWTKSTTFQDIKVYQRNDIFNPNTISSWKVKGKTVTGTNVERMAAGKAPLGVDGKSVNLHHMLQSDKAGIAEMTETFHKSNHYKIHINPNTIPSGIIRTQFNVWRTSYWKNRAKDF